MKGLLLKDLYIAKSNILVIIGSLIVLGFGLSVLIEASALLVLAPPCATTAVFISITSDANSKWSKNVITMPVSRSQIIGEKFILFIILSVLGIMAALIPCGVLAIFGAEITLASLLLYGSIGVSAALFAGCFSLPCAYFFDPDKSQIVFFDVIFGFDGHYCCAGTSYQPVYSSERKYPFAIQYCTHYSRYLLFHIA